MVEGKALRYDEEVTELELILRFSPSLGLSEVGGDDRGAQTDVLWPNMVHYRGGGRP